MTLFSFKALHTLSLCTLIWQRKILPRSKTTLITNIYSILRHQLPHFLYWDSLQSIPIDSCSPISPRNNRIQNRFLGRFTRGSEKCLDTFISDDFDIIYFDLWKSIDLWRVDCLCGFVAGRESENNIAGVIATNTVASDLGKPHCAVTGYAVELVREKWCIGAMVLLAATHTAR